MSVLPVDLSADRAFPWPLRSYPGKRALDVALALAALAVSAPLMVLIAILVKTSSRGPVFYRGVRAGLAGRTFEQLKFRSMGWKTRGGAFTGRDDPRVTPIGKYLRLFKLDELPQFINVLRGEMSFVGPRPESLSVVENCYTREQRRVLSACPGLTCSIDIRTFPDLSSEIPDGVDPDRYYRSILLPARLEEDLQYVDTMSFSLDVKLILQTAYCILVKSWPLLFQQRKGAKAR